MLVVQKETTVHRYDYDKTVNGKPAHETVTTTANQVYKRFSELDDAMQDRIINEAIDGEIYGSYSHYDYAAEEIFSELHKFEKLTGIEFKTGYSETDLFVRFIHGTVCDMDTELLEDDFSGLWIDEDIRDAYNAHKKSFELIARAVEYAENTAMDYYAVMDAAQTAYEGIMEKIGDDVTRIVRDGLGAEMDYYQSREFWFDWLSGEDTLYLVNE